VARQVRRERGARHEAQYLSRRIVAVVAALLLVTPAGCSAAPTPGRGTGSGPRTAVAPSQAARPAHPTSDRPQVTFPWAPGRPQLGMNVFWIDDSRDSDEVVRAKARRAADYLVTVDANSVTLSFPFYTAGPRASSVRATSSTPSPHRVAIALDELRRSGLRTTLRPLMDEKSLVAAGGGNWRGSVEPADRDAWFASYSTFLDPYLKVARSAGATTFVIGAELTSLEGDPRWRALVRKAEQVFGREISYAVNWDSYVRGPSRMPVDHLGIDAYFPLQVSDDASVGTLAAGWNRWLDRRSAGPLVGVAFAEVGLPAESSAYRHPAAWGSTRGRALNLAVQQRWFTAACQVARQRKMAGLYWWKVDFHEDPVQADPAQDRHDSFVGRPGEDAIQSCFSAWGSSAR
jgi:hypothetical protein